MKRATELSLTLRRLIRLAPLAALVVAVNALGDPGGVVSSGGYEREVSDILLSGRHAAGVSNYDDRLLQRFYAEGLKAAPNVLVLGSSRVMAVRARGFAPRSFYNASVSSATLNDIVAVHETFAARGGGPSLVVIGIDPWTFQANETMVGWQTLAAEYERACRKDALPDCDKPPVLARPRRVFDALVSPRYFQAAVAALWRRAGETGRQALIAVSVDTAVPQQVLRRADGSLRYPEDFGQDEAAVREGARAFGRDFQRGRIAYLPPAARPQLRFVRILESFLKRRRAGGTEIWLMLAPYHPDAWPALSADGSMVVQAEDAVRKLGATTSVRVIGSFDPGRASCPAVAEFDDPSHPRSSCIDRILASGGRPKPSAVDTPGDRTGRPDKLQECALW